MYRDVTGVELSPGAEHMRLFRHELSMAWIWKWPPEDHALTVWSPDGGSTVGRCGNFRRCGRVGCNRSLGCDSQGCYSALVLSQLPPPVFHEAKKLLSHMLPLLCSSAHSHWVERPWTKPSKTVSRLSFPMGSFCDYFVTPPAGKEIDIDSQPPKLIN